MKRIVPILIALILSVGSVSVKAEIITDFTYPDLTNVQLISALTSDGIVPFGETEGLTYSTSFFSLTGSMVRVRNTTDILGSVAGLRLSLLVSPGDEIRVEHNLRRLMASSAITFLDLAEMVAEVNGQSSTFMTRTSAQPILTEWDIATFVVPLDTPANSELELILRLTRVSGETIPGKYTSFSFNSIELIRAAPVPLPSAALLLASAFVGTLGVLRRKV